ncbi:MAG TPA: prolipoprotein diacylglyceryl transferase family protein [Polyangiaceae bacterium]|nr:prolipoprotein diacylglyceryl transferase family protein [Polyangiaceae bacterium]
MHPIMFRIPLPVWTLPLLWVFLALAGVFAAATIWQLVTRNKEGAAVTGVLAAVAGFLAFQFKAETFTTGPVPIYSYGVMLGLSLVVGWYLTLGLAERDGLPKETMANNYVITAITAVVGSRILYIVTNLHEFDSFGSMFAMRRGGLVAYGGFLGGFVGSYFFLRRHRIPLLPWADVAVPSLASGLMITRVGCYLFGCDFGQPLAATAPDFLKKLGSFPHWPEGTLDNNARGAPAWVHHHNQNLIPDDAPYSLPVHPTQIYESLVGAGLLVLLLVARGRQKFRGQIFLLFTFAYGVCRYLLEVLRDDTERGSIPPALPEHVLIPLGLTLLAVGYVVGFSKMIENPTIQKVTQVLAFVPPVVLYVGLKPESFASSVSIQLSTSQAVALTTGFAAALAFAAYYKAALAHPESAMALNLPPPEEEGGKGAAPKDVDDEDDEDDDAEKERAARRRARVKAGMEAVGIGEKGVAKKTAKKKKRPRDEDAAAGEDDLKRAKRTEAAPSEEGSSEGTAEGSAAEPKEPSEDAEATKKDESDDEKS